MIAATKTTPVQNSENIPFQTLLSSVQNSNIKPTQNTIENWLQNSQPTSPNQNLTSSTNSINSNNWPPAWLNNPSFTAAVAASVNELYGNDLSSQLFLQQQQLLCNQQQLLANVAGTSIQQQQQRCFKGKILLSKINQQIICY